MTSVYQTSNIGDTDERYTQQLISVNLPPPAQISSNEFTSDQYQMTDSDSGNTLDMTAVSVVGLAALIIFTFIMIIITIIVVRFRYKEEPKDKAEDLEQYRRVPLIPLDGGNLCCDSAASSTKSCSCYTRYTSLYCHDSLRLSSGIKGCQWTHLVKTVTKMNKASYILDQVNSFVY